MEETDDIKKEEGTAATTPKKKSRALLITTVIILLLVAAGGAYFFYFEQQKVNDEATAYEILEGNESLDDYQAYLDHFPNGEHAEEVRERYETLQKMYGEWNGLTKGATRYDYERFKKNYPNSILVHQCDLKIDSLDWIKATEEGTAEAIAAYIAEHPDGRYLSEASITQEQINEAQPTDEERIAIELALTKFFLAFGNNNKENINACITPIMTRFLSKANATKVDVAGIIDRTYNEHIKSCKFTLNNDYSIKKSQTESGEKQYSVAFSVDQYIERDNEGKTFGSYTAEATLTENFMISALTMNEASRR